MMEDFMTAKILTIAFAAVALLGAAEASPKLEIYDSPKLAGKSIVFVTHRQYARSHHNTDTMCQNGEITENLWDQSAGGSQLVRVDFGPDGKVAKKEVLLEAPEGVIRDANISLDAKKLAFSMRKNKADSYNIYEINLADGKLRQLTRLKDSSDLEPVYLPSGEIVFSSTRAAKYCGCNRHIMCNLYRMNPDGGNILQIGNSIEFEHAPSVMRDGRILYTRWEYVDRNFGGAQALWTCNPDGTRHALYWGQETSNPSLDGMQMPESNKVVAILSVCHGRPNGALVIIDRSVGIEGEKSVLKIYPKDARKLIGREKSKTDMWGDAMWQIKLKYEDPYPVSENLILVSRYINEVPNPNRSARMGLFLVDLNSDAEELVAQVKDDENDALHAAEKDDRKVRNMTEHFGVFSAKVVEPRKAALIADQRGSPSDKSLVYVSNVYEGTHMRGIKKGDIKYLRVVENAPKLSWSNGGWASDGEQAPAMNYEDYAIKIDMGIVEVEPDGSAYFEVPSDKFIYLQALDKNKNMLQTMRSGLVVLPGEISSCTGCHESRYSPPPTFTKPSMALRKPPQKLAKSSVSDKPFDYAQMVQPIFDKYCLECHDYGNNTGLNLAGDRGLVFNKSYLELCNNNRISAIGAGPNAVQEANVWGAKKSLLMTLIDGRHSGVKVPKDKADIVRLWIDLNAPYYPSHDSAYPRNLGGRSPLTYAELAEIAKLSGRKDFPVKSWITSQQYKTELVSFARPECSDVLDTMKPGSPEYKRVLEIIKAGAERLKKRPRADMEGFVGQPIDIWRTKRFEKFQELEAYYRAMADQGKVAYDPEKLDIEAAPKN